MHAHKIIIQEAERNLDGSLQPASSCLQRQLIQTACASTAIALSGLSSSILEGLHRLCCLVRM